MPNIWALKSGAFADSVSTSKMFYPAGLTLARKEQLSIIWLAANYDPEKYKKIIPPRECEKANIVRICAAIMNPAVPYALRLSAQLLLGTVRVYRAKTKLILEMAEQMILKLSTLIRETSTKSYDMPIAMLRADAITIADTGMSIIDYSLEPVYYDPQMIMHMNEDDFITVNGSPLQSPIKVEKKVSPKKNGATPTKSPIVVSNSKISFQEDLLSPSRPIQVPPADDDFGTMGFGPAQENFLNDLMNISAIDIEALQQSEPSLKPKALDFGSDDDEKSADKTTTRLESVPEDDEMVIAVLIVDETTEKKDVPETTSDLLQKPEEEEVATGEDAKKREADVDEGQITGVSTLPSDVSRKRKLPQECIEDDDEVKSVTYDIITQAEVSDLDQLLREATALADSSVLHVEDMSAGNVVEGVVDVDEPPVDVPPGVEVVDEVAMLQEAAVMLQEAVVEPEFVIGEVDGKHVIMCADEATILGVPGVPMDWEHHMQTPQDAIILKPLPSQPKKRRKLMVDKQPTLSSEEMKTNFNKPERQTRMPVVAGTSLSSGKELFAVPVIKCSSRRLNDWWTNNLTYGEADAVLLPQDIPEEDEDVTVPLVAPLEETTVVEEMEVEKETEKNEEEEIMPMEQARDEAPPKSPEPVAVPVVLETPSSIDIPRAGSVSLKSFEKSAGSSHIIETPVDTSKSLSTDHIVEGDLLLDEGFPQSPRISGIGLMPEEHFEEPPELDIVLEQGEKSIDFMTDMAEDDPILNESYKGFQRTVFKSLNTSDQTVFQRLFPCSRTKRRDAALALYLTLNMHKNGYVELHQSELFGDIVIKRGRIS